MANYRYACIQDALPPQKLEGILLVFFFCFQNILKEAIQQVKHKHLILTVRSSSRNLP